MVKRGRDTFHNSEGELSSGSENWNVAEGYTNLKILKLMILLDKYENMALYGVDDVSEILYSEGDIAIKRIIGIKRFITTLKQLLGNCKFALKKTDAPYIEKIEQRLKSVEEVLDGISTQKQNLITHEVTTTINEQHFKTCVTVLQNIKEELNQPLNSAGLIFRANDEIDLDKIMDDIVQGG